ncbi:hypothetical protein B0H14DRAFT_2617522 [Mycena olivaceomarginata]|nr:hypothetical protein B0H14DRAFT_2617522 [Mycena olivaceomarginata]
MLQSRTPPLPLCWQLILYGPLQFQCTGLHCSAAQCPSPPCALHATPLVSVIASRFGEYRAVLARVPHLLAPPRKGSTPRKCKLGERSLPYAARRRRICQRFGVTLVRTAHPPAVTPRRTAGAQYPTAGARHHHWYRHGRARSSYSHRHRTVGKRVRRHGVDRPQPGQ